MQKTLDANPFVQFMYITNLEGRKTTHNITHITDRAKYESAHLDEDLSNRDWFISPIKSGESLCLRFLYLPVYRRPMHNCQRADPQ